MAARAQDRAVEIKRHARQPLLQQAFNGQITLFMVDFRHTDFILASGRTTDGTSIRQTLQAELSIDHLVTAIVVHIAQSPMLNYQMYHQQHQDHLQVAKTAPLSLFDADQEKIFDTE